MDFFTCCILVQENPLRDPSTPNAMAWTQLPGSCWNGFGVFLSSFLVCLCLVQCIRSLGLVKLAFLGLPKFLATSTFDGQPYKLLIFTVAQTRATNIEQWRHRVFTYIINREGRSQQISLSCKVLVGFCRFWKNEILYIFTHQNATKIKNLVFDSHLRRFVLNDFNRFVSKKIVAF